MLNICRKCLPLRLSGLLFLFCFTGCGGPTEKLPDLVPVDGVLTLDGKPLSQISVVFEPESEGGASRGMTNEDGKFELMYNSRTYGAVPGKHKLRFLVMDADGDLNVIPKQYEREKTRMVIEVSASGPNHIPIELVSKKK